jgi:hypothetical protein
MSSCDLSPTASARSALSESYEACVSRSLRKQAVLRVIAHAFTPNATDERASSSSTPQARLGRMRYSLGRALFSRDRSTVAENDNAFDRPLERKQRAWLGLVNI